MTFVLNGSIHKFRGTVSVISADNPASACLGGFKQSASAFRYCRHCMGTDQDIQSKVLKPASLHQLILCIVCIMCEYHTFLMS